MQTINTLKEQFSKPGRLNWIGLRPSRRQTLISVAEVLADVDQGLEGDRYQGRSGKRQVTLIQQEHLKVIESFTGKPVTAEMLRRNLVIEGINLQALHNQTLRIGEAFFLVTGFCHPCSRMEEVLGPGGYNAMRGHGGLTARVVVSGMIRVGDDVLPAIDGI